MTGTAPALQPAAPAAVATPAQPAAIPPTTPTTPGAAAAPSDTKPGASRAWDEAGDVPPDGAAPAPGVPGEPVDYTTLALPEDTQLDADDLTDMQTFAQENGLSMAQANALVLREHQMASGLATVRGDAVAEWERLGRADPEIGGERYTATIRAAKTAAVRLLGQEVADWLGASGRFSDPMWLKPLAKLGAPLVEPSGLAGVSTPTGKTQTPADDRALWKETRGDEPYPFD